MCNHLKYGVFVAVVLGFVSAVNAQGFSVSKLALVTCEGQVEIKAPAAKVWAALTETAKAKIWCPYWKTAKAAAPLNRVGNTIEYMDSWGNTGKSVVIYAEQAKELRLAHVPDDGSYVCQTKFQLQPTGGSTIVTVTEQYSDALNVPTDKDTAVQTRDEVDKYMAALKKIVEQPMAKR